MNVIELLGLSGPQAAAVLDERPQVLVAAGAGSGKTRLLVACVVHALIEKELPVDRLVAVTFTRKAGEELSARISSTLEACGRPDLARALDAAATGTIHSLCRRLVKDRALEAGVDPACGVLEAEAAALLKTEVVREVWNAVVEQADEQLLEALASRGESLQNEVVSLYDRLRGMGEEQPRIDIPPGPGAEEMSQKLVAAAEAALRAGEGVPKRSRTLDGDLTKIANLLAWLRCDRTGLGWEAALAATLDFFPSRTTPVALAPYFDAVRTALTRYRCWLAEEPLCSLVRATNRLLDDFHRAYTARKQERGLLDFADLELRARALLRDGREGEASAEPRPGSLLLVDEFQDTNELQCEILGRLGAERTVMVGDERQSIYRFRGADVDVFRRRRKALAASAATGAEGGLHHLDMNYRSSPEVLAFINRVFACFNFFGAEFSPLQPDPAWRPAAAGATGVHLGSAPGGVGAAAAAVEVYVTERSRQKDSKSRSDSAQGSEAEVVADRVRALIDSEDRRQRDIVLLLPALTRVDLYEEALARRGVDVYVVRGKHYYSQEEVTDVASLLRLLVNPHDDLALVSVLRSPLAGLSDDALYLLAQERRAAGGGSLWDAVRARRSAPLDDGDRRLLEDFLGVYATIRLRVGRPGLSRLIDDALSALGYDLCLLAAPGGTRRFANVRKLMRLAGEFEAMNGPDLAGFVELVRSMGVLSDREGNAPTLAEGEDVVRVMTVHQAKGLEFPVVVVAGLGSEIRNDKSPTFVVGRDGRAGVRLKGFCHKTYEEHDLCWGPAVEIAAEEDAKKREEDIRLLYVAMTRAQERLVLVGARPRNDDVEKGRIGRLVSALGLEGFPAAGSAVAVDGLSAVVVGVEAPMEEEGDDEAWSERRAGAGQGCIDDADADGGGADYDDVDADGGGADYDSADDAGSEGTGTSVVDHEPAEDVSPRFLQSARPLSVTRRISFSALVAYQRCPRQFYLERVLCLSVPADVPALADEDDEQPAEGMLDAEEQHSGRDVGLLVHALLERLPDSDARPAEAAVRSSAGRVLADMGVSLSPAGFDRAVKLTLAFWDSPLVDSRSAPAALREAPFFFAHGDGVISGVMDLVDPDPGCWHIVDYKTNTLGGRSPEALASTYAMQAVVYCLAALKAGAPAAQMHFAFLERPAEPVSLRFERDDAPRLEAELARALVDLRRGSFPACPGEACAHCEVAEVCANMARP